MRIITRTLAICLLSLVAFAGTADARHHRGPRVAVVVGGVGVGVGGYGWYRHGGYGRHYHHGRGWHRHGGGRRPHGHRR